MVQPTCGYHKYLHPSIALSTVHAADESFAVERVGELN